MRETPETTPQDTVHNTVHDADKELVEELRDRVRSLEYQLSEERDANRENRRLLAAALERMPAIEPSESRESPEPPADTAEDKIAPVRYRRAAEALRAALVAV